MKLSDALSILGITGDYTPELIKAAYRKACSQYHPDRNPSGLEMMKMINQAFDAIKEATGTATESSERCYGEEINNALNQVIQSHTKTFSRPLAFVGLLKNAYGITGQQIINQKGVGSSAWMK